MFRSMSTRQAAIAVLCLATPGQALAQANAAAEDDHLVILNGRVMAPENRCGAGPSVSSQDNTILAAQADLTMRLSFRLAVSERERRSQSWAPVDIAHETAPLDLKELTTLDISFAAFEQERPGATVEEADRRNRVGLFLGATTKDGHTGVTIGLEYERRLSDLIGIGAVAEGTPGGREFVGAVPVFFHPVGGLALSIGPGFSVEEGQAHFLVRFGVGWDFELPAGLSLAPTLSYDLTEGTDDAIVYGLMLSYAF